MTRSSRRTISVLSWIAASPLARVWKTRWLLMGCAIGLAALSAEAQSLDRETLRRKQEDQQRARQMTRELLGNVLDLQLRQLEENGLQELPVYRDIQQMRGNLQYIVDTEMSKVVDLLTAAQRQPPAEREQSFVEARKAIRTIVIRLSAERQNLLRRLQVAELAEQTRRLIRMQGDVQAAVKSIPAEAQPRQEALLLQAREDQGDVKGLFFPLLTTLEDVRTWGGAMATVCQDGLRILQAAEVGKHLDRAETELAAVRMDTALQHQDGVLKGLRELLKLLEKTQGVLAGEHRAALERLQAIAAKQEALRRETRQLDPDQPPPTTLVEQQAEIPKALAELERVLPSNPTAQRLLEQAETAARDATTDLFDGQPAKAVAEQGQVLGNLAALEELLASGANEPASDKTAAELAALVERLEAVKEKLQQAEARQDAAKKQAEQDARAAAPLEQAAADLIAEAARTADLPVAPRSTIQEAEQAARSAQEALAQAAGPATPQAQDRLEQAADALDRAQATIEAALSDAQRLAAAVKIGELARAAEALERAAAEERDIAQQVQAIGHGGDATAKAEELALRQRDVADIAAKLSEGLSKTAPAISADVAQAAAQVEQSKQQLEAAARQPESARSQAQQAAQTAQAAAKQLAQAARKLRQEVGQTAEALAAQSAAQADALSTARDGVENAMQEGVADLGERMARLQAAAEKTFEAARQQQAASGKPEAAAAMALARDVAHLLEQQTVADAAADATAETPLATPLKNVAQQQAIADGIEQARQTAAQGANASPSPESPLAKALQQARDRAAQAAKALLDGQSQAADQARHAARDALRQAAQIAAAEAQQAMQSAPTAPPDLAAQRAVAEAAAEALTLAKPDAPQAAASLSDAEQSAHEAATALAAQQPQRAAAPQRQTEQSLSQAQRQLQAALQRLAQEQAALLAQQAAQAQRWADEAGRLDADAMLALESAAVASEQGQRAGEADDPQPALQQQAAQSAERFLERAAATLAAKEQQVRRDQAVAEALAAVTAKQQAAADLLDRLRALAETAAKMTESAAPPDAAQALQAADEFSEAQRATGQGAVELSGQSQVAEPMLRAALQKAAALPTTRQVQAALQAANEAGQGQPSPQEASTNEAMDADAPGQLGQAAGRSESPPDTGFIPQSPETTARLMAGPQLTKAMQAADQAGTQPPMPTRADNAQTADLAADSNAQTVPSQNQQATAQAATSTTASGAQNSSEQKNAALANDLARASEQTPDPSQFRSGTRQGDAEPALRKLQDEPWFAKLPPELRRAIGAGAQQKPPRAYEERLRRYFQSVD
uniref:Uncharacterized protein n=1 Tax=Schlesneria paludicola TaxID=360056 RepID=A0A7C4QGN0_9PLAN